MSRLLGRRMIWGSGLCEMKQTFSSGKKIYIQCIRTSPRDAGLGHRLDLSMLSKHWKITTSKAAPAEHKPSKDTLIVGASTAASHLPSSPSALLDPAHSFFGVV